MPERLQENQHALEQLAKNALRVLKQKPDPQLLYSVQLMRVVFNRKQDGLPSWSRVDVRSMLDQLDLAPPNHAQDYLLETSEGDLVYGESDLKELKKAPALDLGRVLLLNLNGKMNAELPQHPSVDQNPVPKRQSV